MSGVTTNGVSRLEEEVVGGDYVVDVDQIHSVEDIKRILAALQLSFAGNHPHLARLGTLVRARGATG